MHAKEAFISVFCPKIQTKQDIYLTLIFLQISGQVDQSAGMLDEGVREKGYALLCVSEPRSDCKIKVIDEVHPCFQPTKCGSQSFLFFFLYLLSAKFETEVMKFEDIVLPNEKPDRIKFNISPGLYSIPS